MALVPDYRINLIAPGDMSEEALEHFTSNFREVMQFIKYSKDTEKLSQLVKGNDAFETMDRKAVRVMEEMTGMKIEKEVEGEKVNVCKAIQGIEEKGRIAGLAEGRAAGRSVSASKHGVVQNSSFPAIMPTSLFEAFFSASFQTALLR